MKIRIQITEIEPEELSDVLDALKVGRFYDRRMVERDYEYGVHDALKALEEIQKRQRQRYEAARARDEADASGLPTD